VLGQPATAHSLAPNVLYYGDNLPILNEYFPDESVDLIYLDPPFNSNRDYSVIFKDESGRKSDAQQLAFEDTWHWGPHAEATYAYLTNTAKHEGRVPSQVSTIMSALRTGINPSPMLAYLVEMTVRLVELHRVLKPTGSLYLHCDPTASHYLRIVLDTIFGPENFRSEIVWRRTGAHGKVRRFGPIHDTLLFYTRSSTYTWNPVKRPYMRGHVDEYLVRDENGWRTNYYGNVLTGSGLRGGESGQVWRGIDPSAKGRHWAIPGALLEEIDEDLSDLSQHEKLDRLYELGYITLTPGQAWPMYQHYVDPDQGQAVFDIWAFQPYTEGTVFGTKDGIDEDVRWLTPRDRERQHWPTQKPLGLLDRIISASSRPGDLVLDPFCGCGTALVSAHRLGRRWIGIDITYLAIAVMKARLMDSFGLTDIPVVNQPTEVEGARRMVAGGDLESKYQFQWWALNLVGAKPVKGIKKKGADKGVDGIITFTNADGELEVVLVSVKSGGVGRGMIQELKGDMASRGAAIGLFVTLEEPTKPMMEEAALAAFYHSELTGRDYQRIQILSIKDLLENGKKPDLPLFVMPAFEKARRVKSASDEQQKLGLD